MYLPTLQFSLPHWVARMFPDPVYHYPTREERIRLVIELSRRNVEEMTGGPFGAAVFDTEDGRLISVGVNLVVLLRSSVAHAEVVAISIAQHLLDSHTLRAKGSYELVSSCEPCAMCLGVLHWAGVSRICYGALDADARAIGFDEGAKPPSWEERAQESGISVEGGLLRDEASAVLKLYQSRGLVMYNG